MKIYLNNIRGGDFEICNSLCFRGENKVLF